MSSPTVLQIFKNSMFYSIQKQNKLAFSKNTFLENYANDDKNEI